jgi:hypothetical protein
MTLTFEHLPESVTQMLHERAQREGRPVLEVALEALLRGLGNTTPQRDLSNIAGSLSEEDACAIEEAVKYMDEADIAACK